MPIHDIRIRALVWAGMLTLGIAWLLLGVLLLLATLVRGQFWGRAIVATIVGISLLVRAYPAARRGHPTRTCRW